LSPEDFEEFSVDLEELRVTNSELGVIKNNAFRHVRGLKTLDLSENRITQFEKDAFTDVSYCSTVYAGADCPKVLSLHYFASQHYETNARHFSRARFSTAAASSHDVAREALSKSHIVCTYQI
jgi:hypothetical protein